MLPRPYYKEQDVKKWQIDTLLMFNDQVVEVREQAEYSVKFIAAGQSMSLEIILPQDFPNEKPTIFINPVLPHPWVGENSNQIVGAPGLINYTIHSDLGQVVQAIVRELQKTAPSLSNLENKETGSPQTQTISIQSSMFPELNELSLDELEEILHNADLQEKLIENDPHLIELDLETEEVMNSIEQIARDNITKQQLLDDLKTDVIDRISTIVQMKMNYEELNRKHQQLSEMYDPHKIRDCLKQAALKADEDAEVVAEQFLLGQIPVEMFIAKFAEKRALGQARRAREERLAHQLAQLDLATS